jgi:hypothetical protein
MSETASLSDADAAAHRADEAVIDRGMATFIEVGMALVRIRDRASYRLGYATWHEYLAERWGLGWHYAWELMASAQVSATIAEAELPAPPNARVAFELRPLLDDPRRLTATWREALETRDRPTAKSVRELVRRDVPPPPPTIDADEDPTEVEPLSENAQRYVRALATAAAHLEAARKLQRSALQSADPQALSEWHARLTSLRDETRTMRTAVARAMRGKDG